MYKNLNPIWNESFSFPIRNLDQKLFIKVLVYFCCGINPLTLTLCCDMHCIGTLSSPIHRLLRFTIEIWHRMTSWGPTVLFWIHWNLKSRSIWNVFVQGQTKSLVSDAFVLSVLQDQRDGASTGRPQQPGGRYGCHSHRYHFICEEPQKQKTFSQGNGFKELLRQANN